MSRPRIRSLKPDLWQHEKVGRLSHSERLLYVGLITMADDSGRLRELPSAILGHVFPYDTVSPRRLDKWLHALHRAGRIHRYEAAGDRIIEVHGFTKHQRINRAMPSDLPGRDHPEQLAAFSESSVKRVHQKGARIGRDRKGRDEEGSALRARVGRIQAIFREVARLEIDEVSVANAVSRFESVDPENAARGCAEHLRRHPDRDAGMAYHRFMERELHGRAARERERENGKVEPTTQNAAAYSRKRTCPDCGSPDGDAFNAGRCADCFERFAERALGGAA